MELTTKIPKPDNQISSELNGNNSVTWRYDEVDKSAYDEYCKTLTAAGYTEYCKNEAVGNCFMQLYNNELTLHIDYIDTQKSMLLIAETRASTILPQLSPAKVIAQSHTPLLTQLGLESEPSDEMCQIGNAYVLRLSDGSFIIIDGGIYELHADNLFKLLQKQSNGGKIVIAAWFFSHLHLDHMGAFMYFGEKYGDRADIEMLVFNPPPQSFAGLENSGNALWQNNFIDYIDRVFPKTPRLIAHIGQRFYVRDTEIEIIASLDLLCGVDWQNDYNCCSLVFGINFYGKRLMFLGDYVEDNTGGELVRTYGDYLSSDFVQVAHHGLGGGGTFALYQKINPEYILWPCGENYYNDNGPDYTLKNQPRNALFKNRKVYVAKYTITSFTFGTELKAETWDSPDKYFV